MKKRVFALLALLVCPLLHPLSARNYPSQSV